MSNNLRKCSSKFLWLWVDVILLRYCSLTRKCRTCLKTNANFLSQCMCHQFYFEGVLCLTQYYWANKWNLAPIIFGVLRFAPRSWAPHLVRHVMCVSSGAPRHVRLKYIMYFSSAPRHVRLVICASSGAPRQVRLVRYASSSSSSFMNP